MKTRDEFAAFLNIGVATLKRWLGGEIQNEALDELVQMKTDPQKMIQQYRRWIELTFKSTSANSVATTLPVGETKRPLTATAEPNPAELPDSCPAVEAA